MSKRQAINQRFFKKSLINKQGERKNLNNLRKKNQTRFYIQRKVK
jgi:hypothetical protein